MKELKVIGSGGVVIGKWLVDLEGDDVAVHFVVPIPCFLEGLIFTEKKDKVEEQGAADAKTE